jgi:hypothetical protein
LTTNVPAITFPPTGPVAPAESAILLGVQTDYQAAFGGNLNFTTTAGSITNATPQGQLTASTAAIVGNVNDSILFLLSMFDPAFSLGRYQDAIARIYYLERNPALPTVVTCICIGAPGVIIPTGALAQDTAGNVYNCETGGTFPATGTLTLQFANNLSGPIPCSSGTLTIIAQTIPGWDTITNPTPGALGQNVETQSAFELRRSLSTANNSLGSLPSVRGRVIAVPGVLDVYATENVSNTSTLIGGVLIAGNSLYICALGGAPQAIATAIWESKAPGCAYNGNTTLVVLDTNSGYTAPFPQYQVTYQTPLFLEIAVAVTLSSGPNVPANVLALVQAAIIGAFAGADGGPRARIGTRYYASRLYAPIAAIGSWVQIVSIYLGSTNQPSVLFIGSIAGTTLTVNNITSGLLTSGQQVFDSSGNIIDGTTIINQISGTTGGLGTYGVNFSQTLVSEPLIAVAINQPDIGVNINQVPVVGTPDITLTLV